MTAVASPPESDDHGSVPPDLEQASPLARWWDGLSRAQRAAATVVGIVLAVNVGLVGLRSTIGGGSPGGPISSSYSTGGAGLEAFADLARASGHRVTRLKESPESATLPSTATALVADPKRLTQDDFDALGRFVLAGGRLVVAGEAATPFVQGATGRDVRWTSTDPSAVLEVDPSEDGDDGAALGSVRRVAGDAGGRWAPADGLTVLLADRERRAVIVSTEVEAGTLVALADAEPLHNDNLASEDNAALALELIGGSGRELIFIESVHGFGATGLDALPSSWKWAAAGVVLALVFGLWSAGSRFGPPEPDARKLRPARLEHVTAVAADLERVSRAPAELVGPLLDANRAELADRLGVDPRASEAVWYRAAEVAGLDPAVVREGTNPPDDLEGALYIGALAAHHREASTETTGPLSVDHRTGTVAEPDTH